MTHIHAYSESLLHAFRRVIDNQVENLRDTRLICVEMEKSGSIKGKQDSVVPCSYCVHASVPAVKTCLHCEASLCEEHFKMHSKSAEHVFTEPTDSLQDLKCPIHNKLIEFYCAKDEACICVSCCIVGEHRGHKVDPLPEAFKKKKTQLKNVLENLTSTREETAKRLEKLEEKERKVQETSSGVAGRATALFQDIRQRLDELEKQAFSEISKQEERARQHVSKLIEQLEKKKKELSVQIVLIEELCKMTDPLTVLKKSISDKGKRRASRNSESDSDASLAPCVNEAPVSFLLHMGLLNLASDLLPLKAKQQFHETRPSDIALDIKTAHSKIIVSSDLKSATYSTTSQKYPDGPERFKTCQVLSTSAFSSGQHYWEVDVSEAQRWIVGVACQSIERKIAGNESFIGYNDKSWSLFFQKYLGVSHNNVQQNVGDESTVQALGIYLDYEAGQLSFYQLGDPMQHLHTFTASFTEPLLPAFYLFERCCLRIKTQGRKLEERDLRIIAKSSGIERIQEHPGGGSVATRLNQRKAFWIFSLAPFVPSGLKALMATSTVRDELNCPICLSIFDDPVMLSCGHNFCQTCVEDLFDSQAESKSYSCPKCRTTFKKRPPLLNNLSLGNITEHFLFSRKEKETSAVCCTYCDVPVPAAKTCLHCEASLCEKHLKKHSNSREHVLTEPTSSLKHKKCFLHKEVLKYYCEDCQVCICISCCVTGRHRGHQVEVLSKAAKKVKLDLQEEFEELAGEREECKEKIPSLQERLKLVKEKAARGKKRVGGLFTGIRLKLENIHNQVVNEIDAHEEEFENQTLGLIKQLELRDDEVAKKMQEIDKLSNMTDSLSLLRKMGLDAPTFLFLDDMNTPHDVDEILCAVILHARYRSLVQMVTELKVKLGLNVQEAPDIFLDVKSAGNDVDISADLKMAAYNGTLAERPEMPERFGTHQVVSTKVFSTGQHYWEVETSPSGSWIVGVAYPSITRVFSESQDETRIGYNDKSWGLELIDHYNGANHNSERNKLGIRAIKKIGVYLDYEGGRLSFYQLCGAVRHLYTFNATFTEPLHAAFSVCVKGWIRISS
ncbi:uncharacterized protein RCH25_036030 [Pelodytes ibericus]